MKSWIFQTLFIVLLVLSSNAVFSQNSFTIVGNVSNSRTKLAIPFAKVYNKSIGQGTLTDENGAYTIPANSLFDTLIVTFIGFQKKTISNLTIEPLNIQLDESVQIISEVVASAKSNDYLYDLLVATKKHLPKKESKTKAYFELKTYIDSQHVELLEGYYNLHLNDYNIDDMQLKTGRFALNEVNQTKFVSLESSKAIVQLNLFANNEYYPSSPTDFKKRQLHKKFRLTLEKRYLDNEQNTIYVINYRPSDSTSNYFNGQIWIDSNHSRLLKITENVINAQRHPFISYAHGADSLNSVNFSINKTYRFEQNQIVLDHIDFDYSLHYYSTASATEGIRIGGKKANYIVNSKAVLMAYDTSLFELPTFDFPKEGINDYFKICTIPYNSFFWDYNTENTVSKTKSENEFYFNNENATRSDNFKFYSGSDEKMKYGFEKPYITWSGKRILFKEELDKIEALKKKTTLNSEKYNLSIQVFMDINNYQDSTNVLTKTIIDPFESFYYLPMDNTTHCFINIYFDLIEIQRRTLQKKLDLAVQNNQNLKEIQATFNVELERYSRMILKSLEHGKNFKELVAKNQYVYEQLGINNMQLFEVTQ